jgi:CHAT domain-containing protein
MSPSPGFSIGWDAGPSSQIEVFSPDPRLPNPGYRLKFTPPFRSTLRPPQKQLQLGPNRLGKFREQLGDLFAATDARSGAAAAGVLADDEIVRRTKAFGGQLLDSVVPPNVRAELRAAKDLYLEIGVDEPLIEYPWELLHDGTEFLCLKHRVARFVNVMQETAPPLAAPDPWSEGPLSVLVISVPIPQQRQGGPQYSLLTGAQKETQKIVDILEQLTPAVRYQVLVGSNATFEAVWEAIRDERFHIVHFSGHAYFDVQQPENSSLVLFDQDMEAGVIPNYFGKNGPVLAFMNGCETAATGTGTQNRYNIFSLARAFLDTGSYLIGNRWKVGDAAAAAFAEAFYSQLLAGEPLGRVIRDARIACKMQMPPYDFSWASFIFYGDPRLCFRRFA